MKNLSLVLFGSILLAAGSLFASDRATVAEVEPNDTFGQATAMTLNADVGTGAVSPMGDLDYWVVNGLSANDLLFVLVDSGGMDTDLNVFDNSNGLIASDADSGGGLDSAVADVVPGAGSVRAGVEGNGITVPSYAVFIAATSSGGVTAESEPNNTTGTASPTTSGFARGDFGDMTLDYWTADAMVGDRIAVICNNNTDSAPLPYATEIRILRPNGTELASEGSSGTAQNGVATTTDTTGIHYVELNDADTRGCTPRGPVECSEQYTCAIVVEGAPVPVELQSFTIE